MNKEKDELVNIFKGIAILMVITVHYAQPFYLTSLEGAIPKLGQMGCQIFFVISGYTLCLSLERKPVDLKSFMRRRLGKIVPGYWTMIIIYFILGTISLYILESNIFGTSREGKDIVINFLLLNGIFLGNANNRVVRGGWFVGTMMIIYILTPLLFKIFNLNYEWWKKKRIWLFPLVIFISSFVIQVICGSFDERYICLNNNFMYFSFINQLPSFCLGFSLYALLKMKNKLVYYTYIIIGGVGFGVSIFLFFLNIKYAFVFVPTLFSVGFVCLFKLCKEVQKKREGNVKKSCIASFIIRLGEISFMIYLSHSLIVYEGNTLIRKMLSYIWGDIPEFLWFLALLPLALICTFILGEVFNWYLGRVNNILRLFVKSDNRK